MPTATGSDAVLTVTTDPTWAGVKLRADFSSMATKPLQVQFLRDTVPVRSGDAAWAPGGVAYAYDHEAPLGATATWTAVPQYPNGTWGAASVPVSLDLEAMHPEVDCWVKPLGNPDRSIALQVHTDPVEEALDARVQVTQVLGRALPSATWDRRTPSALSITLRTTSKAEKDNLLAALDEGPVLVQLNPTYGIDDFFAVPTTTSLKYFVGMFSQLRDVPTSFTPCTRPPTLDAPLRWPGKSYATVGVPIDTYAARQAAYPEYVDVLDGVPAAPPSSGYGAGVYGTETYRA